MELRAADWYPDPSGVFSHRYWNGQQWTEHVSREGKSLIDPEWPRQLPTEQAALVEQPSAAAAEDPEEATRRRAAVSAHSAVTAMMDKYQECFETAERVEKAFAMANTNFVNGIQQAEISKNSFRNFGIKAEQELVVLLGELREATTWAENQWKNLVFLLPGSGGDVEQISGWCLARGESEILGSLLGNGMFINTNFGLTRQAFWTENDRVLAVLNGAGQ